MSASSLNRKVAAVEKAKKLERRNAAIKRYKSEIDISEHREVEVGGISSEASGSDSVIDSGKVEETKPKTPKAKSAGSKGRGNGKRIFSNRKTSKV